MSNRLTFSLASLILIFALAAIPAMAHDTAPDVDGVQHGPADATPPGTIGTHTHDTAPTVKSIDLVDVMARAADSIDTADPTSSTVRDNNVVQLVVDVDAANPIVADGNTAPGEFLVKITFSEDVYNGSPTAIPADNAPKATAPLAITSGVVAGLTVNAVEVGGGADLFGESGEIIITSIVHQVDTATIPIPDGTNPTTTVTPDTEDLKVFYVTFQVPAAFFGVEEADTAALPIDVWVNVDENAVYTRTKLNAQGETVYGEGNDESDRKKFTIVAGFPVAVTAMDNGPVMGGEVIEVTLTATEGTLPTLAATDFTVMEGTTELMPEVDGSMLTITPNSDATADSTVTIALSDAGKIKVSGIDTISVTVDRTAPVVTIGSSTPAASRAGNEVSVPVSFTGAATGAAIDHAEVSVTQEGVSAPLTHTLTTDASGVTIAFTPTAAGDVTVRVAANAVMDDAGNGNAEVSSDPITVTGAPRVVIPVTAAAATTVGGSTNIEVTLSATAPAMVPDDLAVGDFAVMEGDTALTPVVGDKDATDGTVTLTITPTGTGDTTVTVEPSTDGAAKISFDEVEVMVDRTGPMVEIGSVMPAAPMAGDEVTVTVAPADSNDVATGAIAHGDITVVQDADGNQSPLVHTYNTNSGAVTFTPNAESTVTVTVAADAVMDAYGNGNAETSSDPISVDPARVAVAVTATAAAATVNGSTDIEVTLSATAPTMVPDDLAAGDFAVMEGDTALTPVVGDKDATGTVTLTITPTGTGDTTVTVDPSTDGMAKISFDQVSVMVDRTGPMVAFSDVTGAKADTAVMVTITVTGADTGETIAVDDISVVQTVSDGTAKSLSHTYNAGDVTFTPDAMSTVVVSVDADAVMDAVGNGNAETSSSDIAVAPADAVDATAPTVTVAADAQSGRTLPVTFTVADETALGTATGDATLEATEITVTGGTLGTLTEASGVYSGDITIDYDVTKVTVAVAAGAVKDAAATPNASAAVSMDFTVTVTPTPPVTLPDGTFKIPAKSYLIVVHDEASDGLPASITPMTWAAMPDLEALFFGGGTVLLTTDKATMLDRDNKADTDMEAAKKRDALITEVMAAVNTAKVGQTSYTGHQWIELYNNLPVEITVKLSHEKGRPAPDAGTDEIRLDRLSNQVGAGWKFEGLGQNGSDDGVATTADVDFVSFYRKERGGDKDGHAKGHWATSTVYYLAGHKGTPGAGERTSAPTVDADSIDQKPAIFNEISNHSDAKYEWIEILVTDGSPTFENWQVSMITAVGTDEEIFTLPKLEGKFSASGRNILLVTSTDPALDPDHPLAPGYNVEKNDANQVNGVGADHPVRYIVREFKKELPADGKFILVLRHGNDKRKSHEKIEDIAGWHDNLKVDDAAGVKFTNLWPLRNYAAPNIALNKLESGKVHYRQKTNIPGTKTADKADNADHVALRDAAWTGIGYRRNAANTDVNGGTPGYANNAQVSADAAVMNGASVIISEIMYDVSGRRPQWVELFNTSHTNGVGIDNWSLFVVNHNLKADGEDYLDGKLSERIDLDGHIPPRQTFLIVSTAGADGTNLPPARIHNLRRGRGEKLLNPYGFRLTLKAKTNEGDANKHQLVDDAGNLPDLPANNRRADAQSFMDPVWMLPSGKTDDGDRVSIARKTDDKIKNLDGTKKWHWIRSDIDTRQDTLGGKTYYGHTTDIASPGTSVGGVLPVSLSKFRPERLDDGSIRIAWITESETNNAGFNILRSEKRDGEFTKINTKLIAGQGTTSERTAYTYTDPSAKPNVVYYYQIQDVSLDGKVQTLRTTHLRGNVTAVGKATTTWGELKALQ